MKGPSKCSFLVLFYLNNNYRNISNVHSDRGKQWQTIPKKLAQDAAYQSHTGRLTGLWFLSKLAQGLNANNKIINSDHF
jgi:hypothetical protein